MPLTEEQNEQNEQLIEIGNITLDSGNQITYTSGNGGIRENGTTPMFALSPNNMNRSSETLLDFRPLGSWIIFERHIIRTCTCSYCNGFMDPSFVMSNGANQSKLLKYLRVKFKSPSNKGRNSWRKIIFKGFKYYYYLRWTLPRPELIAKKIMEIIGE